ncbi:MAG: hypothetical protein H6709_20300 [Kofleriaceae bacterium]|nr:hypothetical protein [Kofleriaceae bacterium]
MKPASIAALLLALLSTAGCASSGDGAGADARVASDGGGAADADRTRPDAGGTTAACPDGQVATAVASNGELTCGTVDDATAVAVRSRCAVYVGQRDSCDGCTDGPAKWSEIDPLGCSPGSGGGNACIAATLDDPEAPVTLATLDLDGDVNDDDKLFTTLHCILAPRPLQPAPCAPGWAVHGRSGDAWMCAPISEAAVGYVGSRCAVYLGWQDSCDGCTTPPAKWGHANDAACVNGAGADDTCVTTTLGGETVNLIGINTDGDVDGNDKLHLGLACEPPAAAGVTSTTMCPDGLFVTGTSADGSFTCGDPAAAFAAYLGSQCSLFFGWRDSCDACTGAPTKWGQVSVGTCATGVGADDTCTEMTLDGTAVQMFGLNTDGDVNSDDTLYVGFRCAP